MTARPRCGSGAPPTLRTPGPDGPHGARKLERAAAERALACDWPFDIPYWVTIGERVTWRKP